MFFIYSSFDLSISVSSILKRKVPPSFFAKSQLNRAVLAVPRWRVPVGLGANLTLTVKTDNLFRYGTDGIRTRNFRRDRAVL